MKRPFDKILLSFALVCSPVVLAAVGEWNPKDVAKSDSEVRSEKSIERRRVTIVQKTRTKNSPSIYLDRIEMETARKIRLEEKTEQLIKQIESLIQRQGQSSRMGELKMRLSELYFERASAMAARESESWEKQVQAWEASGQGTRPVLKTPMADRYRQQALALYRDLERMSRGSDQGRSQMVHRDEVLFFLGSTLTDLGQAKESRAYYEELVNKFPRSPRIFAGRLALADLLFDTGNFTAAIPHYLRIAVGEGAPPDAAVEVENLRSYGLYKLAWCYMNTGSFDKAVMAFQRTVEASKNASGDQRLAFKRESLNDLARAFALAGQYSQGEEWFQKNGFDSPELMHDLRKNIVDAARDHGDYKTALANIDRLLKDDPSGAGARDLAFERAKLIGKQGNLTAYANALAEFAKNYGEGSDWLSDQKLGPEEKKLLVDESVAEIRREAKTYHKAAQVRNSKDEYRKARPFYEAYLQVVPSPNPDTAENLHEMRFYFAELLYKLEDYPYAAKIYAEVGEGKYGSAAAYSRIAALKSGAKKDKSLSKELTTVTQEFIQKFPQDERAGDLLYASAYESFESGAQDQSLETLRQVVTMFPGRSMGVESAERILFIHEKKGELQPGIDEANNFLANKTLVATGGKDFVTRVDDYRNRAKFKMMESLPDSTPEDRSAKGRQYLELSRQLKGDLREKALNNALVFSSKGGDATVAQQTQDIFIKEFPSSNFAKDIYLQKGDAAIKQGQWGDALSKYGTYLKLHGSKKDPATESARWNVLYMQSRLEGHWRPELNPSRDVSPGIVADSWKYLEDFPKTTHKPEIVTVLAFRKGATPADLEKLRKFTGGDAKSKSLLDEAVIVLKARTGKDLEALAKANPPSKATTELLKEILAKARFDSVEKNFQTYAKRPLNYKRFAPSLKEKMALLEKLDKDYMSVVAYGNGDYAMLSLERLSKLYRTLASDIERAPGVTKEQLAPFTKPLFDKGLGFLQSCMDKATEYKIGGAGVASCRQAALEAGVIKPTIVNEILPEPKWVPQASSDRALLKILVSSLGQNRFGEFNLTIGMLDKAEPPLTETEQAELMNLTGLAEWRLKQNQSSAQSFRKASDVAGSDAAATRTAAMKNLAAVYIQVRDYAQALDVLGSMTDSDVDVALMKGLALKAQGQPAKAVEALDAALSNQPANMTLTFNKALASAAAGDYATAATTMGRYVETTAPTGSHISRALLREWKGKAK